MNVGAFPDLRSLDASASLRALTDYARTLNSFGRSVSFDSNIWDLSHAKPVRAYSSATHRLFFTRLNSRIDPSSVGCEPYSESFSNTLKILLYLREFKKPCEFSTYRNILSAASHLYEALAAVGYDIVRVTRKHFEQAFKAASNRAPATQRTIARALTEISAFIDKHALAKVRTSFKPSLKQFRYLEGASAEARAARAIRMPSEELIDAIIAMSNVVRQSGNDDDILRSSIVELLMCAPWRINELLSLRVGDIRRQVIVDPKTGTKVSVVGFFHKGSKGAKDSIKWIPSAMREVAERAYSDIKRITAPYRKIALWMSKHPGRAFLAEPFCLADPETLLTTEEVSSIFGISTLSGVRYRMTALKVPFIILNERFLYRLADLESAILKLQETPVKTFDPTKHLLLVPLNFFRSVSGDMTPVLRAVKYNQIGQFLKSSSRHQSVFERLKILDCDGRPYEITSHVFRHYLNTIAKDGGLPELDIARWSGRERIEQNAVYDHTNGRQLATHIRSLRATQGIRGPKIDMVEKLPPIERDGYLSTLIDTAHMTDIGACVQNWTAAPCPYDGGCADCGDHLVIKGNEKQLARATRLLAEHEEMLAIAKAEMNDETFGASNWVAHHQAKVAGLKAILAVHFDEKIPNGTFVQIVAPSKKGENN